MGQGFYPQEDAAVREIIAAFEQESGKQVELVFHPQAELLDKMVAEAGRARYRDFQEEPGRRPEEW